MVNPERLHNAIAALDILARADSSAFEHGMNVSGEIAQDAYPQPGTKEHTLAQIEREGAEDGRHRQPYKNPYRDADEARAYYRGYSRNVPIGGRKDASLDSFKPGDRVRDKLGKTWTVAAINGGEIHVQENNHTRLHPSNVTSVASRSDAAGDRGEHTQRYTVYFGKGALARSYDCKASSPEEAEEMARARYGANIWITSVR